MKKLNNKGFTLVELLAVIIILAVVVGISIPAVMSTVSNAKVKAFQTAANTCADWIERQYQLYAVDPSDTTVTSSGMATAFGKITTLGTTYVSLTSTMVQSCGLKTTNVKTATSSAAATTGTRFTVTSQGRVKLILEAATGGDYDKVGTFDANAVGGKTGTQFSCGGVC